MGNNTVWMERKMVQMGKNMLKKVLRREEKNRKENKENETSDNENMKRKKCESGAEDQSCTGVKGQNKSSESQRHGSEEAGGAGIAAGQRQTSAKSPR